MLNAHGCKKKRLSKQYGKRNQLHFKEEEEEKMKMGFRPQSAGGNKPREQKGRKLSKGGENSPSFNSSGLVRYGYAYWRHRRGVGVWREGVTAPACLRTSPCLGYDKNSAVNHGLQCSYVYG